MAVSMTISSTAMRAMVAAGATAEMLIAAVEADELLEASFPRTITPEMRASVIARDGLTCVYCDRAVPVPHLDHVLPRSRGGRNTPENLVVSCKPCNSAKGPRTPEEWRGA
jgi:hypothetical protein